MHTGLALLEIHGLTPAMVALDRLDKAARVRLVQMELNDFYGVFLKIAGDSASLRAAVDEAPDHGLAPRAHRGLQRGGRGRLPDGGLGPRRAAPLGPVRGVHHFVSGGSYPPPP